MHSMHSRIFARALLLVPGICLLSLVFPQYGHAQSVNSAVDGLVQDSSGALMPGAEVALTNLNTRGQLTTQTNEVGRFIFPSVPAGSYEMTVTKEGFRTHVISDFKVVVAQRVTQDVVLEIGAAAQSVTVQGEGLTPLLEPSSNELGTLIETTSVQRLPLDGRNFLQLGLLSGATQDSGTIFSDFISAQGGHPSRSINIAGNQQDFSMYLINGMATAGTRMGHAQLNISVAAVDQFKVRHGFFLPGLGPDPGIVNVITKAGSNRFHGEVFEFLRNNKLDARGFFDTLPPPPFRRNQFGAAAGGPVLKDRLFFFGHYEGLRQQRTVEGLGFAPSQRMFQGDFSEILPTQIFDPDTFDPLTGKRQPFPNNVIPPDRINSVATNLLDFYIPGSDFATRPFNLSRSVRTMFDSDTFGIRLDANLSQRNTVFGQYLYEDSPVVNGSIFPLAGTAFPLNSQLAMLQWTTTVSPRMVNEVRIGWTRGLIFFTGEQQARIQDQIGITGTADADGPPSIILSGIGDFGKSNGLLGNIDNLYQIHEAVNYLRGNQEIRFGVDIRYMRTIQQSANATARGIIAFNPIFSAQLAPDSLPVAGTGNSFADFLLGMPTNGQVISMPRTHYRFTQFEPYFQDSWKIRPGLTLNLGFAWHLATPPNPVGADKNSPHALDFTTGRVRFAALGDIDPKVYETDFNNVTPRIGLAWQPSFFKNTVVRAGWGVYFASQRLLDQQFSIVAPGVSLVQAVANSISEPFPTFVLGQNVFPPLTTQTITREFADNISGAIFAQDTGLRTPYVEQWNFSVQHTLGERNLIEVAYVGNQAHKLNSRWDANDCSVADSLACVPSAVRWSQYPFVLFSTNDGNSNYHALVAKFHRQFSRGFSFLTNYTWSKSLSNSMESGGAGTLVQRAACRRCDKGLAAYNVPQRFVVSLVWDLPFGQGQRFLGNINPVLDHILGGWAVSTITTFSQGNSFEVNSPNVTSAIFSDFRADRLCDGRKSLSNRDLRKNGLFWIDPSCFQIPASGFFGNSGFGILSGPGVNNWDIAIEKNITVHETLRVQFRTEFFNAWNHAQFLNPDSNVASVNFGRLLGTRRGREIQFGLKVLW